MQLADMRKVSHILRRGGRYSRSFIDWFEGRRWDFARAPIFLVHVVYRESGGQEAQGGWILEDRHRQLARCALCACIVVKLTHIHNIATALQIVLGEWGGWWTLKTQNDALRSLLLYSPPKGIYAMHW